MPTNQTPDVSLTGELDAFVHAPVDSGDDRNAGAAACAGLRRLIGTSQQGSGPRRRTGKDRRASPP